MLVRVEPHVLSQKDIQRRSGFTKPFFHWLRILLFFGGVNAGKSVFSTDKSSCSKLKKTSVTVVFLSFLMMFVAFCFDIYKKHFNSERFATAVTYLLMFASTLHMTVINSWMMPKSLPALEESFHSYETQYGLHKDVLKMPRNLKILTIGLVIIIYGFYPFHALILKMYPETMCMIFPTCNIPHPWKDVVFFISAIAYTILFAQWEVFLTFCISLYLFLLREFKAISKPFKNISVSVNPENPTETSLDVLINQYEALVEILNRSSDCVQHYSFVALFMSLPIHCSFLYAALDNNNAERVFLSGALTLSLFFTGIRLLIEGSVSVKAQEPLQYLWKMKKDKLSDRVLQKLNLFVSRLSGDNIGFSIYGLLTINMPTLLAIFGTLATYFIIAIQFKPQDKICNCDILPKNISYCLSP